MLALAKEGCNIVCADIDHDSAQKASEQAGYITGTEILIDGGQTMLVLR